MSGLALVVLAPFLVALFIPFIHRKIRIHTGWFVLILPIIIACYIISLMPRLWRFETFSETLSWIPSIGIDFALYLDGLSLLFTLLITGIGALVVLYSIYYLPKTDPLHNFYVYLLMFMGAMLGIVLSDNMLVMYVFWELTSISSFLLIGYWYHRERSQYGAQKSMFVTMAGGFAMMAGMILLYTVTGTFSIRESLQQAAAVAESPYFTAIMALFLAGAFTKSAQFPFYIWLPDAMEAPTPVSAYLHSATMVKAGIYLIARMTPLFGGTEGWFWTISTVGLFTMVWAAFLAIRQTDLKAILAFSTVSQLGLIVALLGFGTEVALLAAVFHLFNHAAFKGSLFMVTGIVDHETGTRDIRRLGGLYALMPVTATLAFIGAFAMAGIPLTNGFLSKEMFFQALVDVVAGGSWWIIFPIIAVVGSVFTFIYSMILSFKVFTGQAEWHKLEKKPREAPVGMLLPPVCLGLVILVVGLFPGLIANSLLAPVVNAIAPNSKPVIQIALWHGLNWPLLMSITVIVAGFLLYRTLPRWEKVYHFLSHRWSLNQFYDQLLLRSGELSGRIMNAHMTGFLRDYLAYILTFIALFTGIVFLNQEAFVFHMDSLAPVGLYEVLLALTLVTAAVVMVFSNNRLAIILMLGVMGYAVALFFVNFRAPDLALTQLVIETVTVALFLLSFYHLPRLRKEKKKRRVRIGNMIISLTVGVLVTVVAMSSYGAGAFKSISNYYIQNSHDLAGGDNIVNVILVDFRGTDTMLEILVLGIAALGVFGLIKLKLAGGRHGENE